MLWLNRAALLEQSGDAESGLSALQKRWRTSTRRASPGIGGVRSSIWPAACSIWAAAAEAAPLLPGVRALAEEQRDTIDLIRVNWLEGRSRASRSGRCKLLPRISEQVWLEFTAQGMDYDSGLSALNLAECYLTAGRHAETRALALQGCEKISRRSRSKGGA